MVLTEHSLVIRKVCFVIFNTFYVFNNDHIFDIVRTSKVICDVLV